MQSGDVEVNAVPHALQPVTQGPDALDEKSGMTAAHTTAGRAAADPESPVCHPVI